MPWNKLCVDLIGPYIIRRKGKKEKLQPKAVKITDPVTGWFELVQYYDKGAINIANLVESNWMSSYHRPIETMYDQGKEFIGHEFRKSLIGTEYRITAKPITPGNPIPNAVLERIHQVLGNLIRTFNIQQTCVD